jgi:molybdate transport system substrate-binding protein
MTLRSGGRSDIKRIAKMQRALFLVRFACACSAAVFAATSPAAAADIRVYTSGAPADVQKLLAPAYAAATGHRLVLTVGTLAAIVDKAAVDTLDAVVLAGPAIETLDKKGVLRAGSRVELARVGIGVTVRAGAPRPDVSSVDALRKLLLDAKSIVHPDPQGGGITGAHIARMIERMGIAEAVKPKVKYLFAIGGGVEAVAKGDAEVGLFNISEILPVAGAALAGPFPAELQSYVSFAGAVHAMSGETQPAQDYLRWLSQPPARDAWTKGGFEPPR